MSDDISDRVRLRDNKILSSDYFTLGKASLDYRRTDGEWQAMDRQSLELGPAMAVLPMDKAHGLILLVRQFRWPVFQSGHHRLLTEAVAGRLDGDDAETCARREALEEAGVAVTDLRLVCDVFSSPGVVNERVAMFLAAYDSAAPRAAGGGLHDEGEDIEVVEMPLDEALALVASGEIIDAKTILLLQAAKLAG